MTIKELQGLIRIFGGDAKVKDVNNVLKFIAEVGQELRAKGNEN